MCLTTLTLPIALHAQQTDPPRANTGKLMLSLGLGGTSLYSEDLDDERHSGGGFSGQLGWGCVDGFELYATTTRITLGLTWQSMLRKK